MLLDEPVIGDEKGGKKDAKKGKKPAKGKPKGGNDEEEVEVKSPLEEEMNKAILLEK